MNEENFKYTPVICLFLFTTSITSILDYFLFLSFSSVFLSLCLSDLSLFSLFVSVSLNGFGYLVCLCLIYQMCSVPKEARGIRSSWAGATKGCEPSCGFVDLNLVPLETGYCFSLLNHLSSLMFCFLNICYGNQIPVL